MTNSSSNNNNNNNNNNNSGGSGWHSIRPVLRRFPATRDCLDECNIPLSVTVIPLWGNNDAIDTILNTSSSSNNTNSNAHDGNNNKNEPSLEQRTTPSSARVSSLTGIPKCGQCGAPHACSFTHGIVHPPPPPPHRDQQQQHRSPPILVCYLCGHSAPASSSAAAAAASFSSLTDQHQPMNVSSSPLRSFSSTTATTSNTTKTKQQQQQQQMRNDHQQSPVPPELFALPLRLPPHPSISTAASAQKNTDAAPPTPLYSVPAVACPVLWLIGLDGSPHHHQQQQQSYYWKTVSETVTHCLRSAPPHVHVALYIGTSVSSSRSSRIRMSNSKSATARNNKSRNNNSSSSSSTCYTLGIFDLSSAVPHIRYYHYYRNSTNNNNNIQQEDNNANNNNMALLELMQEAILASAVPADSPHIATALRSLLDYRRPPPPPPSHHRIHHKNNNNNNHILEDHGCPVAWMTELVLAALVHGAIPAGQHRGNSYTNYSQSDAPSLFSLYHNNNNKKENDSSALPWLLPYAGATLTFFLANRPAGVSSVSKAWPRGAAHTPGTRFAGGGAPIVYNDINISKKDWEDPRQNPNVDDVETGMASGDKTQSTSQRSLSSLATETELTPQRLFDHYQPEDKIEEYYADLGRQCADAAVGVDFVLLIALDGSNSSSEALEDNSVPDFGLPLFLPLAERSGTGAPLIVDLASLLHSTRNMEHDHSASPSSTRNPTITKSNSTEIQSPDTPLSKMYRDVLARTPWQPGIVFGAELRVRISPGFAVDPTMISRVPGVSGPQLAPLYYEAGLVGPASGVGNESTQLWRMGTTDPYTAFTMDLELTQPKVPEYCHVDGLGNVPIKPVIQTCFAYTTIIPDVDPQSGKISYQTVRRMRIASRPVPLAFTAEATYASLDTESLAVVLFHKIALASVQDGIVEAANMARQWVQLLMACVYRSAYANLKLERENAAAGIEPNKSDQTHRYFYPGERLLHLEGELSTDDVLLAQGHDRLRPVVLMVYLLLQSDPLRLSEGGQYYRPSFDYRSVLLSRMTSMTPCTLTRCIAPRLQLWESGANVHEPILEVIDLRSDAVQSAVLECSSNSSTSQDAGLILFLDTPEKIVVMDARYVNSDYSSANGNGTSNSPRQRKKSSPLVIGEGLKHAIEDAASSYRTRPDIVYQLDQSETSGEYTLLSLLDCLLEDTPHAASGCESFMEWKAMIARAVQTDVESSSFE